MNLPPLPKHGEPIQASWGRQVIDYLRALTPRSSATVRTRMSPGGSTYETRRPKGAGISIYRSPLQPYALTPTTVAIMPGTIGGLIPTIGGIQISFLDEDGLPPQIVIGETCDIRATVTCGGDEPEGFITGVSIAAATGSRPPDSAASATINLGRAWWDPSTSSISRVDKYVAGSLDWIRVGYVDYFRHYFGPI